mgnify:CR=1 FL=1
MPRPGIVTDASGKAYAEGSTPFKTQTLAEDTAALCKQLILKSGCPTGEVKGIGIGCAGMIDSGNGAVVFAGNLGLKNYPLAKLVREATGFPVKITNDANAAALGEATFGAGKNYTDSILVTLGTGVGGGIIIGGKLFEGYKSVGAEIGHTVIGVLKGVLPSAYALPEASVTIPLTLVPPTSIPTKNDMINSLRTYFQTFFGYY